MPERRRHARRNGPEREPPPQSPAKSEARARGLWTGTIGFGLVSIPVELFPANRPRRLSLRMLGDDGTPLGRRYYDPESGKNLGKDDLVRGFEVSKDEFVVVKDEELESLAPEKSRDIELSRFVDVRRIDPLYFERAYFLLPWGTSDKAYRLLVATMERTKRAGIATFVMREKQYRIAVLAEHGILRAETLRYADELRTPEQIGLPARREPASRDVQHMEAVIERHGRAGVDARELRDEQAERLLALARHKAERGQDVVRAEEPGARDEDNVIDLMSVLKRSLESRQAEPGNAERTPTRRAGESKHRSTRGPSTRKAGRRPPARGRKHAHARSG